MPVRGTDAEDPDGAEKDGCCQLEAEEFERKIAGGAVHHHARNKTPVMEGVSIVALRELIATPALHIRQNGRGHRRLRFLLEKLEVNREFGNDVAKTVEVDLILIVAEVGHSYLLSASKHRT